MKFTPDNWDELRNQPHHVKMQNPEYRRVYNTINFPIKHRTKLLAAGCIVLGMKNRRLKKDVVECQNALGLLVLAQMTAASEKPLMDKFFGPKKS